MIMYDKIKKALEEKLKMLERRVATIEDHKRTQKDDDFAEAASESENDEAREEIQDAGFEEIKQVKLALKKIQNKTYGECEECGAKIDLKRLLALPYANVCIDCKTEMED